MEKHQFHYASAKNFLCFGEEGIQLKFDSYGPIVVVKGINKDTGTPDNPASNGSGKSSIQDIISYAIFGKTVKKPKKLTHAMVVHKRSKKKDLVVEVQFGEYRIERKRNPNELRVWKSRERVWDADSEVTRGTMKDTQAYIDGIVGLTHQAFCNVVIFDDSQAYSFLEADGPTKRVIVENLLDLDRYRALHDIAKEQCNSYKGVVKSLTHEYEKLQNELAVCDHRIKTIETEEATWLGTKRQLLEGEQQALAAKKQKLYSLDDSKALQEYQRSQEMLAAIEVELQDRKNKLDNLKENLRQGREKLDSQRTKRDKTNQEVQALSLDRQAIEKDIAEAEKLVDSLGNLAPGARCTVCHSTIDTSNYADVLEHEHHVLSKNERRLAEIGAAIDEKVEQYKQCQASLAKFAALIEQGETKERAFDQEVQKLLAQRSTLLKVQRPDLSAIQQVLESEIEMLQKQIDLKTMELSQDTPHRTILNNALQEKQMKIVENDAKVLELRQVESTLPYYEYWLKAFGDDGLRKYIIEGIIPSLNSRIAYWMQPLYNGVLDIQFDNTLEATITRKGIPADYDAMSKGETQRANLAISQSFAYVMVLTSGNCPSIVFLDEITGGSIDKSGVSGVFNMICELSKERQVFVTTHNEELLNMLDGCQTLTIVKEDDVSKLSS